MLASCIRKILSLNMRMRKTSTTGSNTTRKDYKVPNQQKAVVGERGRGGGICSIYSKMDAINNPFRMSE